MLCNLFKITNFYIFSKFFVETEKYNLNYNFFTSQVLSVGRLKLRVLWGLDLQTS